MNNIKLPAYAEIVYNGPYTVLRTAPDSSCVTVRNIPTSFMRNPKKDETTPCSCLHDKKGIKEGIR